jgi:hypothetical protein
VFRKGSFLVLPSLIAQLPRIRSSGRLGFRIALWGVKPHGQTGESAHGVVKVSLRLSVDFDASYFACECRA